MNGNAAHNSGRSGGQQEELGAATQPKAPMSALTTHLAVRWLH